MSDKPMCSKRVMSGTYPPTKICGRAGKVERDGKWYCGIHDPVKVAEKDAARKAKWDAEWKEKDRQCEIAKAKEEIVRLAKEFGKYVHSSKEEREAEYQLKFAVNHLVVLETNDA